MASCYDCIHFNPCNSHKEIILEKPTEGNDWRLHNKVENECKHFNPTADVVEVDKVAEMFAEQFGDKCPCNFNDNDEWLTLYCDYTNTCDCPCKDGWKQFIKHYDKRKEQE